MNSTNISEHLSILMDEKSSRLQEMFEYNRRLDRTVILYITAAYSVLGLNVTGNLDVSQLEAEPEYAVICFLFFFLNMCIILHGVSQSAYTISLAKFVHVNILPAMKTFFDESNNNSVDILEYWDDWQEDVKNVATQARNTVTALWILFVEGISLYSLRLFDVKGFYFQYPIFSAATAAVLFIIQTYVFFILIEYGTVIKYYHIAEISLDNRGERIAYAQIISMCLILLIYYMLRVN